MVVVQSGEETVRTGRHRGTVVWRVKPSSENEPVEEQKRTNSGVCGGVRVEKPRETKMQEANAGTTYGEVQSNHR